MRREKEAADEKTRDGVISHGKSRVMVGVESRMTIAMFEAKNETMTVGNQLNKRQLMIRFQ